MSKQVFHLELNVRSLDDVTGNLDKAATKMRAAGAAAGELTAIEMAAYAKKHRGWHDRTNQARLGLTGSSETSGTSTRVVIAHTPFYGVFLELANGGKYAILEKTIRAHRASFLNNVKTLARL